MEMSSESKFFIFFDVSYKIKLKNFCWFASFVVQVRSGPELAKSALIFIRIRNTSTFIQKNQISKYSRNRREIFLRSLYRRYLEVAVVRVGSLQKGDQKCAPTISHCPHLLRSNLQAKTGSIYTVCIRTEMRPRQQILRKTL